MIGNPGPFDATLIVTALAAAVPDFKSVGTTVDVASAQASQQMPPCAFVLLGAEKGGERQGGAGIYRQRIGATIGVLIGVQVYGSETGGASAPDVNDLVKKTRLALLGTTPTGALTPLEFIDGRILLMDSTSTVWWLERYRLDYWMGQ